MISQLDLAYLNRLRETSSATLLGALRGKRDVAIIDAPNQRNVGDSLIWDGELAYLKELGLHIHYVADLWTYDPVALRRSMPEGVVLLHGGGNFGDLWLGHQILREIVATDLVSYPIVQLPQSIHFRDPDRATVANKILGSHPDFILLLRDQTSMDIAALLLPDVAAEFCYDMALGSAVTPSTNTAHREGNVLVIARKDVEAASGLSELDGASLPGASVTLTDWYPRGARAVEWHTSRAVSKSYRIYARVRRRLNIGPVGFPDRIGSTALSAINSANIRGAKELYSRADLVIVDRLHAHILAVLLGIPHIVLDNSYGKISGIFNEYSGAFSTANYVDNLPAAIELAEELRS